MRENSPVSVKYLNRSTQKKIGSFFSASRFTVTFNNYQLSLVDPRRNRAVDMHTFVLSIPYPPLNAT